MSRSGYSDCWGEEWLLIMWRGAVASALRGRRGQAFLKEMLAGLDALVVPRLISADLVDDDGEACALGSVGLARGLSDLELVDPYDRQGIAELFGIAPAMAAEIMYINDYEEGFRNETPEQRWVRVRAWVEEQIR